MRCFPLVFKFMVTLSDICFHVFVSILWPIIEFFCIPVEVYPSTQFTDFIFVVFAHYLEDTNLLQTRRYANPAVCAPVVVC